VGKAGGIPQRFFEVMGCPICCGRRAVIDDVIKLLFQYLSVVLAKGRKPRHNILYTSAEINRLYPAPEYPRA
jgi:hypothetical protein